MKNNKETSLSERIRKDVVFVLFTILLVMILVMCISATAMSQTQDDMQIDEAYYLELESTYLQEVRTYLQTEGFENSGIALTRVVAVDGAREYVVQLHHKGIGKLNVENQKALLETIENMAFEMPGCSFEVNLLG